MTILFMRPFVFGGTLALILDLRRPLGRSSRGSQEEEERQDRNELKNHGNCTKPNILPGTIPQRLLLLNL